ncbi:MAG TPA: glutamine-hydrolyzing GMP synthase [Bryobacteraceae bacterium]|nr:glutamine-hydrolyzing GMP synthase [Bryobacteraceae bacterium]
MTDYIPSPQITVLDTGGQYTHLIARKVRELGVYADVKPSETPAAELHGRKGLIISGGPSSVYEDGSPTVDPAIFEAGSAVLGICYGQQLMSRLLGGVVDRGDKGEYGLAALKLSSGAGALFAGAADDTQQIWMSHRDTVRQAPPGFAVLASTDTCSIAAIQAPDRKLYGVQFHPEVVHTRNGRRILSNFLFEVCGCTPDWDPKHRGHVVEEKIREVARDRNVFFFVSGGVDSTVAFTLCLRALGEDRVSGFYVDTGLMREGETRYVQRLFKALGSRNFMVEEAGEQFLSALDGVTEPEAKRKIIGEEFVEVQERILRTAHFLDGNWILGQGTIYPDTIESGGTAKADLIKTHHNRVAGIQRLIEQGRIVEPLTWFYKDEVREIGRELALPEEFLERHPFPGPGLAIRCLCAEKAESVRETPDGWIIPVHSVGVQGDMRSYRPVLAIEGSDLLARATELINRIDEVNRVIAVVDARTAIRSMAVSPQALTAERLDRLRRADAIVREVCHETGFEQRVWQFPVITIPFGTPEAPDSVVLRPVDSVDGMTAASVEIPADVLESLRQRLMAEVAGVAAVFVDLTHKPPGTIEWE